VFVATVLAGCYAPHPHAGTPCPSGACPDPLVCSPATHTCETTAIDAPVSHDARAIDAALDSQRPPVDAPNQAMLVQQAANHADADTLAITLAQAPAAGDMLVFVGGDVHAALDASTGVAGGGVSTWKRATYSDVNTNIEIWYGVTSGGATTITATGVSGDMHPIFGIVSEWSGLLALNPLDGVHATDGIVSPADPGAIVTANAHDLLIFGVGDASPNAFGAPSPGVWTALTPISADVSIAAWYRIQTTAGFVHPTVSETNGQWDAAVVALQVAP
jgi:hypothetical protein